MHPVADHEQPVGRFEPEPLDLVPGLAEHPQRQLLLERHRLDVPLPGDDRARGAGVHRLHLPAHQVDVEQQGGRVGGSAVPGVQRVAGQSGLFDDVGAGAAGVAHGVDRDGGEHRGLQPVAVAVQHGQGEPVAIEREVEVVAVHRVRRLQLPRHQEALVAERAARQQFPLQLRGHGEALPADRPAVAVGDLVGGPYGDGEFVRDGRELTGQLAAGRQGGLHHEDAEALAPDGQRQVRPVGLRGDVDQGPLAAETAGGQRSGGRVRVEQRPQTGHGQVAQQHLDPAAGVVPPQVLGHGLGQPIGRRRAQERSHGRRAVGQDDLSFRQARVGDSTAIFAVRQRMIGGGA